VSRCHQLPIWVLLVYASAYLSIHHVLRILCFQHLLHGSSHFTEALSTQQVEVLWSAQADFHSANLPAGLHPITAAASFSQTDAWMNFVAWCPGAMPSFDGNHIEYSYRHRSWQTRRSPSIQSKSIPSIPASKYIPALLQEILARCFANANIVYYYTIIIHIYMAECVHLTCAGWVCRTPTGLSKQSGEARKQRL